ncbi:hypothetical protein Lal_00033721 [Lupinus albus]|nr:hypothetical protein Lal_00033721 [Lupinus albus]
MVLMKTRVLGKLEDKDYSTVANNLNFLHIVFICANLASIIRDLKLMFAIKELILVNRPAKIPKVMSEIASSCSRLLAYGIFISRVISHLQIDASNLEVMVTNSLEHLVGDYLIHKMELTNEEGDANQTEQNPYPPQAEASNMPLEPPFGLAHLDAMEQSLNERIDSIFQSLNYRIDSGFASLYDIISVEVQRQGEST